MTNGVRTVRLHVSVSLLRVPAVSKSAVYVAMVTFGISHVSINVTWLDAKGTSTAISAEQWRYYLGGIKTSVPEEKTKEKNLLILKTSQVPKGRILKVQMNSLVQMKTERW